MSSLTKRTKSDRAARRREVTERMVAATERLLEQGESFTELSVERLVSEAGVSRSTFYTYFEDKGHLLRELTEDVLGQLGGIANEWWGDPERDPTQQELKEVLHRLFKGYREHDELVAAVSDTAIYDPAVREVYDDMVDRFIAAITKLIEARQRDGKTPSDIPAKEVATMFTWMTERTLHETVRGASPEEIERLSEANTQILWRTLYTNNGS